MSNSGGTGPGNPPAFQMSDLGVALPPGAGLNAADRAGLVNALKDKLQFLAGRSSGFVESLSAHVKDRVTVLQTLQGEHDDLEAKFHEERAALEAKYQKLYDPLYRRRFDIVNGVVDVEHSPVEGDRLPEAEKDQEKGVPEFWLTAMKTNEILAMQITERDEGALKFLKDIKWSNLDDNKGFKLDFYFETNPYFKETLLTKIYHMIDDDEPILERATGTRISWFPGKNLTTKLLKKKPKKGANYAKPVMKTEQCESFFNFFSPPQVPDDDDIDQDTAEQLQDLMEQDYDVGSTIKDKIIPHAVSWFTGEALQAEDYDVEDEDGEDDDEDDDDEDEDDEDDENEEDDEDGDLDDGDEDDDEDADEDDEDETEAAGVNQRKKGGVASKSHSTSKSASTGQPGQGVDQPPDCKQQ